MNKEKLVSYEEALNVAVQMIGNNEVSDVLEEIIKEIGDFIDGTKTCCVHKEG